jgi:hypothetical protein
MRKRRFALALLMVGATVLTFVIAGETVGGAEANQISTSVKIVPSFPWTDAGVNFNAGQTLSIVATGNVDFVGLRYYPASPAGTLLCLRAMAKFVAPALQCYSLIAKIGADGTPFEVGTHFTALSVATSGELYLGVNDNHFPDNRGMWTAVVTGGMLTPVTTPPNTTPPATTPPVTTPLVTAPAPAPTPAPKTVSQSSPPATTAPATKGGGGGVLAFTGFGPIGQLATLLGAILVLLGLFLYFIDVRRAISWILGR